MVIKIKFGRLERPIPFERPDQEKINAKIIETTKIYLNDYPVGTEMVKVHAEYRGLSLGQDTPVTIIWRNEDTDTELFRYRFVWKWKWTWAWVESWIGHKPFGEGEIDRPGNYSVTVSMEGYKTPEPKDVVIEEEGRTEVHFAG